MPWVRLSFSDCADAAAGCEPELTKPCTSAAPTESTTAAGTTTSPSLRFLDLCRRGAGALSSTRCRRRSGATGGFARSSETRASYPSISLPSNADIGHLLFQSLQSPAEPGRTSRCADSKNARRARAVELEQHAQRHHLTLGRGQAPDSSVELRRQALGEDGLLEQVLVSGVALLAPLPPSLGPEPVDRGGVSDAAEPGAGRTAARIEAAPAAEGPLERLRREILRGRAVAREVDEVAVDGVEVLRDDIRERRCCHPTGGSDGCRQRVHGLHTAPGA